jgi:hypothetical protein
MDIDTMASDKNVDQLPHHEIAPTTSGRRRRFPAHFQDFLPSLSTSLPHMPQRHHSPPPVFHSPTPSPQSPLQPEENPEPTIYETEANKFGMYRVYRNQLSDNPDNEQDLDDLCDSPGLAIAPKPQMKRWWSGLGRISHATRDHIYAPFLNSTIFRLMDWFYSGSNMTAN